MSNETSTAKHASRLQCAGCGKAEGWCECPNECDCLSCVSAELLEALKALVVRTDFAGTADFATAEMEAARAAIAKAEGHP